MSNINIPSNVIPNIQSLNQQPNLQPPAINIQPAGSAQLDNVCQLTCERIAFIVSWPLLFLARLVARAVARLFDVAELAIFPDWNPFAPPIVIVNNCAPTIPVLVIPTVIADSTQILPHHVLDFLTTSNIEISHFLAYLAKRKITNFSTVQSWDPIIATFATQRILPDSAKNILTAKKIDINNFLIYLTERNITDFSRVQSWDQICDEYLKQSSPNTLAIEYAQHPTLKRYSPSYFAFNPEHLQQTPQIPKANPAIDLKSLNNFLAILEKRQVFIPANAKPKPYQYPIDPHMQKTVDEFLNNLKTRIGWFTGTIRCSLSLKDSRKEVIQNILRHLVLYLDNLLGDDASKRVGIDNDTRYILAAEAFACFEDGFQACPNRVTLAMQDLYWRIIAKDPQGMGIQGRVLLYLQGRREDLFRLGLSFDLTTKKPFRHDMASVENALRRSHGQQFGVSTELSAEDTAHNKLGPASFALNIQAYFDQDYTPQNCILTIISELKSKSRSIPLQLFSAWCKDNLPAGVSLQTALDSSGVPFPETLALMFWHFGIVQPNPIYALLLDPNIKPGQNLAPPAPVGQMSNEFSGDVFDPALFYWHCAMQFADHNIIVSNKAFADADKLTLKTFNARLTIALQNTQGMAKKVGTIGVIVTNTCDDNMIHALSQEVQALKQQGAQQVILYSRDVLLSADNLQSSQLDTVFGSDIAANLPDDQVKHVTALAVQARKNLLSILPQACAQRLATARLNAVVVSLNDKPDNQLAAARFSEQLLHSKITVTQQVQGAAVILVCDVTNNIAAVIKQAQLYKQQQAAQVIVVIARPQFAVDLTTLDSSIDCMFVPAAARESLIDEPGTNISDKIIGC